MTYLDPGSGCRPDGTRGDKIEGRGILEFFLIKGSSLSFRLAPRISTRRPVLPGVRLRMMGAGGPIGNVVGGLAAPGSPTRPRAAGEHLQKGAGRTRLDQVVGLVRLARMLPRAAPDDVDLATAWSQRAGAAPAHTEEDEFGRFAEIETDATSVRPPVLADFVPQEVALLGGAPGCKNPQVLGQERVRYPQIEMGRLGNDCGHRQRQNIVKRHRCVSAETLVLRRHFGGTVLKLPRRIREHGAKLAISDSLQQLTGGNRQFFAHLFPSSPGGLAPAAPADVAASNDNARERGRLLAPAAATGDSPRPVLQGGLQIRSPESLAEDPQPRRVSVDLAGPMRLPRPPPRYEFTSLPGSEDVQTRA